MPARVSVPADAAGTCLSLGETDQKQPGFYMSQRFFDQQPEVSRLNDPEYVGEMRPVITNMNRFQPAQGGKWRVFRTNIALRADNPHPYAALTFEHMYGERLAVYDGERCVYDGEPAFGLRVELERRGRNDIPIFLLIKAAPDAPAAGFKRRVLQSTSAFPMSPASQMAAGEALRKDNFF